MNIKFKKIALLFIVTMFLIISVANIAFCKTLSLGHIVPIDTSQHEALVKFADLVKEKTDGEVIIEIYPSSQLGTAPDQVDGVRMGSQDMFAGGITWWKEYSPRVRLVETPFIWNDRAHFENWVNNVMSTKVQDTMIKKANQRFINLDVLWRRGPYRALIAQRPVMNLEDLKGLKLRIWEAHIPQKIWQGLGASTVTLPWGETYLAIRQGIAEAVTSPMDSIYGFKFSEVAKYITEIKSFPQIMGMTINENVWNSMTDEQQEIILNSANQAGNFYNEKLQTQIEIDKQKMMVKHDAIFIQINNESFMKKARKEVFPELIENGVINEEYYNEINEYIVN